VHLVRILPPTLLFLFFFQVIPGNGLENMKKEPWKGKLRDGTVITEEDLAEIVTWGHYTWIETNGTEGRRADLREANLSDVYLPYQVLAQARFWDANLTRAVLHEADLTKAELTNANLTQAFLYEADLSQAEMIGTNLTEASLEGANLTRAKLIEANLTEANLHNANLTNAKMWKANLAGANLQGANLTRADLQDANVSHADMRGADLTQVVYEPMPGSVPYIPYMTTAKNLSTLTFSDSTHGLIELREGFKRAGLREQERQITYAIEHTKRINLTSENPFSSLLSRKEDEEPSSTQEPSFIAKLGRETVGWIYYAFVELTCNYGMTPWRPLLLLLFVSIPVFTLPYVFFLRRESNDGIWKVWHPERRRKDLGKEESSKPLRLRGWPAIRVGFYFSILSAFSIGWRELNVANWIVRIQRYEYNYRATGWARSVSGMQSLLSVYLLALWALTYFSRPFE
jgi:uncharacterized protein YjbI with pentapeptide repeats